MSSGITPVIAVILLLLITISLVGFAFVFLTRTTETAAESGEQQLEQQISQIGTQFVIDNAAGNKVYIRNTGATKIPASSLSIYLNGVGIDYTLAADISQNSVGEVTIIPKSCKEFLSGNRLRITAGVSSDSVTTQGFSTSGVYKIKPDTQIIDAYCDMTTEGGGWTQVVFENFESPTSGWSTTNTITSCGIYGNILGGYNVISTATNSKTYNLLNVPHTQARSTLDYIKIDSWDSEQAIVTFGGAEIFRHTYCFCSQGCQNSGGTCGGDAVCGGSWNEERKIPVNGIISHTANAIDVFGDSTIDQLPSDESWGFDNIKIFVR